MLYLRKYIVNQSKRKLLLVSRFFFFPPSGSFSLRLDWQSENTDPGNTLETTVHQPCPVSDHPPPRPVAPFKLCSYLHGREKCSYPEMPYPPLSSLSLLFRLFFGVAWRQWQRGDHPVTHVIQRYLAQVEHIDGSFRPAAASPRRPHK